MRRFYASEENFSEQKIVLGLEESKHLRDVLRLSEGGQVRVFDGAGKEFLCEIERIEKKETVLKIIERVAPSAPESSLNLTLAVALLKGEKFDLVVQKAVELGVTKLVPLNSKRADVKLKDADKKIERWRKIALEAAKQSGRAKLMQIDPPVSFEKLVAAQKETIVLFSEKSGQSFESFVNENSTEKKITAIVGAEGGWEDEEIETARRENVFIATLGGRILRAETAAIVVSALLQNHFGDLR